MAEDALMVIRATAESLLTGDSIPGMIHQETDEPFHATASLPDRAGFSKT